MEPVPVSAEPWRISAAAPPTPKVVQINLVYRFVVLNFNGRTPLVPGTRLNLFRQNQPVAVVRVTDPIQGNLATADILDGEPRPGDEARPEQRPR